MVKQIIVKKRVDLIVIAVIAYSASLLCLLNKIENEY